MSARRRSGDALAGWDRPDRVGVHTREQSVAAIHKEVHRTDGVSSPFVAKGSLKFTSSRLVNTVGSVEVKCS